ncbi:MAG: hypothetical protein J1E96_01510 [Ruminococcus sp.]|nr:hypothetical protein [Ruminococcus sp.]
MTTKSGNDYSRSYSGNNQTYEFRIKKDSAYVDVQGFTDGGGLDEIYWVQGKTNVIAFTPSNNGCTVTITFNSSTNKVTVKATGGTAPKTRYYIVGPSPIGKSWTDYTDSNYELTDNGDGTYSKTYTSGLNANTNYDFFINKYTSSNSFVYSYNVNISSSENVTTGSNGNNIRFSIGKSGFTSVTITYNPSTGALNISAVFPEEKYYVTGAGATNDDDGLNGSQRWGDTPSNGLMKKGTGNTYSITYTGVNKGTYRIKVKKADTWNGAWGASATSSSGNAISGISDSDGNALFQITKNNATVTVTLDLDYNNGYGWVTVTAQSSEQDTNVIYVDNQTNQTVYFYVYSTGGAKPVGDWNGLKLESGASNATSAANGISVSMQSGMYVITGLTKGHYIIFSFEGGSSATQSSPYTVTYGSTYTLTKNSSGKIIADVQTGTGSESDFVVSVKGNPGYIDDDFWDNPREMTSRDDLRAYLYSYEVPNIYSATHTDEFKIQIDYLKNSYTFCAQANSGQITAPSSKPTSYNTWRSDQASFKFSHESNYKYTIWVEISKPSDNEGKPDEVFVWVTKELLGTDEVYAHVNVYAKDGMVRDNFSGLGKMADTEIINSDYVQGIADGTPAAGNASEGYQTAVATVGQPIQVKTTLTSTYKDKYYVRGFCINGRTYDIYEWNEDGVYTLDYVIPDSYGDSGSPTFLEITPVYYLKNTDNTVVLQISNFDSIRESTGKATKGGWGNTFYAYFYYDNADDALGQYPGQPVIYQGGIGYVQVPIKVTPKGSGTGEVKGLTFNNGNFDQVHATLMGWQSSNDYQCQTYDYDDFVKIYKEKNPTLINFTIQNRTSKDNPASGSISSSYSDDQMKSTFTNGWNTLRNYNGLPVDLFGNALDSNQQSKTPLRVVSNGYVKSSVGTYATEWIVFAPNGTQYNLVTNGDLKGLPPSALVINNADNFSNYDNISNEGEKISKYKALYETLKASYEGVPVLITYEKNLYQTNANRLDGRWTYATAADKASANIIIEYRDNDSAKWTEDPFKDGTNEGNHTGAKAYFTGEYNGQTSVEDVLSNPNEYFHFNAQNGTATTSGQYVFDHWALYDEAEGTYTEIDTNGSTVGSHIKMGDITLVARFKLVTSGFLTLSHELFTDKTYFGFGKTEIKVDIYNDDGSFYRPISDWTEGAVTINSSYIKSNSSRNVIVTLRTTSGAYDNFVKFGINRESGINSRFFTSSLGVPDVIDTSRGGVSTRMLDFSIADLFDDSNNQEVKSITYYSYITTQKYTYDITYKYNSRIWGTQTYKVAGTFYESDFEKYASGTKLLEQFIIDSAPAEKNFKETVTWDPSDSTKITQSYANNKFTVTLTAKQEKDTKITARFNLPFAYGSHKANEEFTVDIGTDGLFKENGKFITAEKMNGGKYFNHWLITDLNGKEIAKCFYIDFNFSAYQNVKVTPVYTEKDNYYQEGLEEKQGATVSFLEDSRNQWNDNAGSNSEANPGDVVFTDFQLAFSYKSLQLNKESADNYKIGLFIEDLGQLYDLGNGKQTDMSKYEGNFESSADALKTQLSGSKGSFVGTPAANIKLSLGDLDNKNQMHYYYYMYASANGQTYSRTNKVFRAYAYIGVKDANGKWTYEVSETPVYFTMYSRVNG